MIAQELKNSILQLAIQGKLVEQRAEEGTAKELIEQIKAEKEQLIKDKKIKKEKPLAEITEDEIPFDIPENWEWVRLKQIATSIKAGGDKPKEFSEIKTQEYAIPVIANGIKNDGIIGYTNKATMEEKCITVSARGTIGFSCIRREPFSPVVRLLVLCMSNKISYKYIQVVLSALLEKGVGTSIQQLTVPMLEPKLIPIPPTEEQKRIVAKIEELMPYVEQYDKAYTKLEAFNKKFPEDMQKSILQYAIQGKLVEQREEEGTAEELYQQIQEEKARLIKEGKIKKEKTLEEITEDEIPFDIPDSWKWVRLGKITSKLTDGSHNPPPNTGSGYYVISAKNIKNGKITFENVDRFTDEIGFQKENKRTCISKGDIIMGIIGGSIGNLAIYEHDEKVIAQRSIAIIDTLVNNEYIRKILQSPLIQYQLKASSGTAQGGVYLGTLSNIILPLPPMKEQKRIVAKIEEMLQYCQQLKK